MELSHALFDSGRKFERLIQFRQINLLVRYVYEIPIRIRQLMSAVTTGREQSQHDIVFGR